MVYNLSEKPSIFNHFLAELRDVEKQRDPMRFRRNLERVGECMAMEISKHLAYIDAEIETPLGFDQTKLIKCQPVLATILRAGLPMHQGLLNYFDHAESAFISAYRRHTTEEEFEIQVEYMAIPDLTNQVLIISDPMLATGSSMLKVYKALLHIGNPSQVHICAAIAAPEALAYLKPHIKENTHIWIGALDQELTAQSYIVPGLGDAGDLAFGIKI
jgi:uracil phosphoribosyltransferase